MSLQQWRDNGWIISVQPSARDIAGLLGIAEREIGDASLAGISADGEFAHAYDAIRALCEAALHACGYAVPKGGAKHQRLIESLKFTIDDKWAEEIDFLDRARRLRHQAIYDRMGVVQRSDADQLLETARRLDAEVRHWLRRDRSHLLT